MNTPTTASEHLLLFRGTHWDKSLSPEEFQNYGLTAEVRPVAEQCPPTQRANKQLASATA